MSSQREEDTIRPTRTLDQLGIEPQGSNCSQNDELLSGVPRTILFDEVLSDVECESLLSTLNYEDRWHVANGTSTSGTITYRISDRMMFNSPELCDLIMSRIQTSNSLSPFLETIHVGNQTSSSNDEDILFRGDVGSDGEWAFASLNPCIRALKYKEGGHFLPHSDGSTILGEEKSFLTMVIYLNDNFNGGATKMFYDEMEAGEAENKCEIGRVIPKQGRCVVFDHNIIHSGETVFPQIDNEECFKYILRTELMYKRNLNSTSTLDCKGVEMLREAEAYESNGDFNRAIELYGRLRFQYPNIAEAAGI